VKYDDASWHSESDFPPDLRDEVGGTHIAMFLTWAALSGRAGDLHIRDGADLLAKLQTREISPRAWFFRACDGQFCNEDLNDEGNAFALGYYLEGDGLRVSPGGYLADYSDAFPDSSDLYLVPDNWETFDRLKPMIDRRFAEWRSAS
jgi:hypothetical protein